jgi:hypothetical protein
MPTFATDSDLLAYEPDITKYGIQEFDELHEQTYDDIIRLLNIRWFPKSNYDVDNISVIGTSTKLSPSKLTPSQFTRAAVYHVLYQYVYPRLSTFDPNGDVFREKMVYYKQKFEEEFDLILRLGVEYDVNSDGTISESEKQSFHFNRLVR